MRSSPACSLAVMIGLNIWNKGRLRLFCILIGMAVGYVVGGATGMLTLARCQRGAEPPLFAIPTVSHLSWSFDWALIVPFAVTGLAAAMSATAVVTTYQRLTDADWVRPDMTSISRGIFGDGIAAVGRRAARHLRADDLDRQCRAWWRRPASRAASSRSRSRRCWCSLALQPTLIWRARHHAAAR